MLAFWILYRKRITNKIHRNTVGETYWRASFAFDTIPAETRIGSFYSSLKWSIYTLTQLPEVINK